MKNFDPDVNIRKEVLSDALQSDGILIIWDGLTHSIPPYHEAQSVYLLKKLSTYGLLYEDTLLQRSGQTSSRQNIKKEQGRHYDRNKLKITRDI